MSKVRLLGARLSENPATIVISHPQGVNGLVNKTGTGKLFYVVSTMAMDGMNPVVKSRMVWANDNSIFALSGDDYNSFNKGVEVEGELQRFDDVKPYKIEDRVFTHVKLLVFKGENPIDVIREWENSQANRATGNGIITPPVAGATPSLATSIAPVEQAVLQTSELPVS